MAAARDRRGTATARNLLLDRVRNAHRHRANFRVRDRHADGLGVGVRDRSRLADVVGLDLLFRDATGLADRDLDLLRHGLVAAHLHGAGLTNLDLLAAGHRIAFRRRARNPALDRLGLRAFAAASARVAAIATLVLAAEESALQATFADRDFFAFPVALIDRAGLHFGHLLAHPTFLHDRLFGPGRDLFANRSAFHHLFRHIALAAHGAGARLAVGFATVAGAFNLTLLRPIDGAGHLALFLTIFGHIHRRGATTGIAATSGRSAAVGRRGATVRRALTLRLPAKEVGLGAPNEGDRQHRRQP